MKNFDEWLTNNIYEEEEAEDYDDSDSWDSDYDDSWHDADALRGIGWGDDEDYGGHPL